jgi:hypothetical protein
MWLNLPFAQVSSSMEQNMHITFSFPNPLSESKELQSWGCSKILLWFLMQFYGNFWPNQQQQQQQQQCLPQLESILDSHLSRHLLPAPLCLHIEKRLIGSEPHSHKPFFKQILWQLFVHFHHPWCKDNWHYKQVITRTLLKINKWNSVRERMLVDST